MRRRRRWSKEGGEKKGKRDRARVDVDESEMSESFEINEDAEYMKIGSELQTSPLKASRSR